MSSIASVRPIKKSCDLMNFCAMDPSLLPALETIAVRFSRLFKVTLSNGILATCKIEQLKIRRISMNELSQGYSGESFISIFQIFSPQWPAILIANKDFGFATIDGMCGGNGSVFDGSENKQISCIDIELFRAVSNSILDDFQTSWQGVAETKFHHIRYEVLSEFISIIPPEENVFEMRFSARFPGAKGEVCIAIPCQALFPIRNSLI